MNRLLAPLVLALALAGCRPPDNPARRYRLFVDAARDGQTAQVWAMLSAGSRKALAERARALGGEKQPAGVEITATDLVLGDLAPTAPKVKKITVVRESKDAAVVRVEEEGGAVGEVSLVREGELWRVELPGG